MKKIIFLAFFAICFIGLPCFSQEEDALNHVILSHSENTRYLNSLESAWVKIKKLPQGQQIGNSWSVGNNYTGTIGKIVENKRYLFTIDRKAKWDDGNIISEMTINVFTNNVETRYFPLETITFYYNHTYKQGMVIYVLENFFGDPEFHKMTSKEIRKKINEVIENINQYI